MAEVKNHITGKMHSSLEAVEPQGNRWYIRVGFAGFNSDANNADGYPTPGAAMRAAERYAGRSKRARVCNECGEAFLPDTASEWTELRKAHKAECDGATFRATTEDEAF